MRILIDIGHPAHVHVLKHFAHEMEKRGHFLLFTCRQKEFIIQLLEDEGFHYVSFGQKYTTTLKKLWGMLKFDFQMFRTSLSFRPDFYLSLGSMYAAQVSSLMRKPHICIEDTYNMEQIVLYRPFTDLILTGNYEHPVVSKSKEVRLASYNELAYLHPSRFVPDNKIYEELGISMEDKYVILRFNAWKASHDIGHDGISLDNKIKIVNEFSKYAKVFISSEEELPDCLQKYQLPIHPNRIHHAIAFSALMFGESYTMSEEASMLGVPALQIDSQGAYYTRHLQGEYGIMVIYPESIEGQRCAMEYGIKLLKDDTTKNIWQKKRENMLMNKIDYTSFLVWLVENYPESKRIMLETPDYQYNFR